MKGLGTSTNQEGKEYFSDLGKHRKDFVWVDGEDDDPIKLAFSKKKIEASKNCFDNLRFKWKMEDNESASNDF
ncbi:hypothetical protein ACS0TY_002591 [Phlomoides rotata]